MSVINLILMFYFDEVPDPEVRDQKTIVLWPYTVKKKVYCAVGLFSNGSGSRCQRIIIIFVVIFIVFILSKYW